MANLRNKVFVNKKTVQFQLEMADKSLADNPFAALFPSLSEAQQFTANYKSQLNQSGTCHLLTKSCLNKFHILKFDQNRILNLDFKRLCNDISHTFKRKNQHTICVIVDYFNQKACQL